MIKPSIKSWIIQGHGYLDEIHTVFSSGFHLALELEIEYSDMKGVDDYVVYICDKDGLKLEIDRMFESKFEKDNDISSCFLSKTLIIKEFNKEKIELLVMDFIKNCEGKNWEEVNLKLQEKLEYIP
jgi:uncharacterized protein YwgA